jgi:hypothetical protein
MGTFLTRVDTPRGETTQRESVECILLLVQGRQDGLTVSNGFIIQTEMQPQ